MSCHKRTIISESDNQKGHNSLPPWSILMILVSFCRFPMIPDTLSMIPVTSDFKVIW